MTYLLGALLFISSAFAKDKLSCGERELAQQDCRLTVGTYDIRLLAKTIAWSDGTWHTVDPVPLAGEAVAWEKIQFGFIGHRPILQLWLWDKGVGETQIESLHWYVADYVADAEKRKFTILGEGVVRKRRPEAPPDPAPPPAAVAGKPAPKPPPSVPRKTKFIYDPPEVQSLKALKDDRLEWQLGSQRKIIESAPFTERTAK